jgi:hypothetical protein
MPFETSSGAVDAIVSGREADNADMSSWATRAPVGVFPRTTMNAIEVLADLIRHCFQPGAAQLRTSASGPGRSGVRSRCRRGRGLLLLNKREMILHQSGIRLEPGLVIDTIVIFLIVCNDVRENRRPRVPQVNEISPCNV